MLLFIVFILFLGVLIYFSDKITSTIGAILFSLVFFFCVGYVVYKIDIKEIDNTPIETKTTDFKLVKLTDTNMGGVYVKNDWVAYTKMFFGGSCDRNDDFTILNIDFINETKTIVIPSSHIRYHSFKYQSISLNSDDIKILVHQKCVIILNNNRIYDVYVNDNFYKDLKCITNDKN